MKALKLFIGAGFGSGYAPVAPGTFGSLFALVPAYFSLSHHPIYGPIICLIVFSLLCFWVGKTCSNVWGPDPGKLVMDEFAGQAIVFISFSATFDSRDWVWILVAFALFRFFDILKPLGINQIQKLKGNWGVLLDDILAGFYALLCLKSLIFLVNYFSGS